MFLSPVSDLSFHRRNRYGRFYHEHHHRYGEYYYEPLSGNNGGDYAIGAYGIISSYSIQVSMLLMGICQGMQSVIGYFMRRAIGR